jgi:outer membrane PBP1 activator LpoA protein
MFVMQRVLLFFLTMFALYAGTAAQTLAIPDAMPVHPAIKTEALASPVSETKVPEPVVETDKIPVPHIALLLPLTSSSFSAAAEAVRQGFMVASNIERQAIPIRVYSDFDENNSVTIAYHQAIANGAIAVVGPLTHNGVLALAALKNFPVPTLSLNVVDNPPEQNLYFFGMAIETEARQIAQIIKQKGVHQTIIVTTRAPFSKRLQAAFQDEWNGAGGQILREIEYNDDPILFEDIADTTDTAIFLATDAEKARLLRPYLSNKLPIYATSRVFVGNDDTLVNYDLNDIRFVDMPWLLQMDHPAVMTYPRANPPLSIDNERLYALGIDAFRLIQLLFTDKVANALPLDGVSGQIQLQGHAFQRTATPAVFAQGHAQLNETPNTRRSDFPDSVSGKP